MPFLETCLSVLILSNVVCLGIGVEVARKVGKHVPLLRRLWGGARRRFPHLTDGILKFAEIWDAFTESTLDFEDRFAIFCDELGDFLEALVQRVVDSIEWLFALDAAEQAAALSRVPRRRLAGQEHRRGVGTLKVKACAVCLEDWKPGDEVRVLPACHHVFHCGCVDSWIYRREQCPVCRKEVRL